MPKTAEETLWTDSRRPPQQRRSRATLARFLTAGAELLEEKSFDDLTIQEIVARAESSVGSFYARFRDKQGLLDALRAAFEEDAARESSRLSESKDWCRVAMETAVREHVRILVREHRRHRGTLRALVGRSMAGKPAPDAGTGPSSALPLLALLRSRRREIVHPDPDVAAQIGVAMVVSAVRERVLFPELASTSRPATALTDAVFAEELSRALVRFLGVNSSPGSE